MHGKRYRGCSPRGHHRVVLAFYVCPDTVGYFNRELVDQSQVVTYSSAG